MSWTSKEQRIQSYFVVETDTSVVAVPPAGGSGIESEREGKRAGKDTRDKDGVAFHECVVDESRELWEGRRR